LSPRRSDYQTRKEYRWAKKVESRQASKDILTSLPPLKTSVTLGIITWFIVAFALAAALPSDAGAPGGAALLVAATVAAVLFPKSRPGRSLGKAWDDHNKKAIRKMVESGDDSTAGQYAAKIVAREEGKKWGEMPDQAPPDHQTPPPSGVAEELERLDMLKRSGSLSEDEFQRAKSKLLE